MMDERELRGMNVENYETLYEKVVQNYLRDAKRSF